MRGLLPAAAQPGQGCIWKTGFLGVGEPCGLIKIINIINIIHYGIVTLRFAPISDEEYMHISLETWRSRRRGARGAGGLGGAREEETAEEEDTVPSSVLQ